MAASLDAATEDADDAWQLFADEEELDDDELWDEACEDADELACEEVLLADWLDAALLAVEFALTPIEVSAEEAMQLDDCKPAAPLTPKLIPRLATVAVPPAIATEPTMAPPSASAVPTPPVSKQPLRQTPPQPDAQAAVQELQPIAQTPPQ